MGRCETKLRMSRRSTRGVIGVLLLTYVLLVVVISSVPMPMLPGSTGDAAPSAPGGESVLAQPSAGRKLSTPAELGAAAHPPSPPYPPADARCLPGWSSFAGKCGDITGKEVRYTEAGRRSPADCGRQCAALERCAAATITPAGECRMASTCEIRMQSQHMGVTFVRPRRPVAPSSPAAAHGAGSNHTDTACTFCPAPGPCEEPYLCRFGRCFRGPQLPDASPCDDGNPQTHHDVCAAGACRGTPDDNAVRTQSQVQQGATTAQFEITQDRRCVMHASAHIGTEGMDGCASQCLRDLGCASFSFDTESYECQLFAEAKCKLKSHGWVTGVRNAL